MALNYTRIPSKDPVLERIQDGLERIFNVLNQNPLLSGKVLENVRLFGSEISLVPHGLGRIVRGCFPVRQNVLCLDMWMEGASSVRDWPAFMSATAGQSEGTARASVDFDLSRYVPVYSTADATVDLFVF